MKPLVLFFTGFSGSGKSTVAFGLSEKLNNIDVPNIVLDGDIIRNGLCNDLGFSKEDRSENIRRVSEVAKLFSDIGFIVIVSFIAPYEDDRNRAKTIIGENFREIFIDSSLDVCKNRDVKGLYGKAMEGLIKNFTGISDSYDVPNNPDLIVKTSELSIEQSVNLLYNFLF